MLIGGTFMPYPLRQRVDAAMAEAAESMKVYAWYPQRAGRVDLVAEHARATGTRDYVRKNGFRSVILGLSGGIDSALAATIAADAIGPDRVHVVLMPSRYSSDHSVGDAEDLAKRQGLHARTVPIAAMFDAFGAELDLHGLAAENLQARIRGMILMSLSNEDGHLVLTTGNKSEIATGYSTLYGDSAGMPVTTCVRDCFSHDAKKSLARGGIDVEIAQLLSRGARGVLVDDTALFVRAFVDCSMHGLRGP